MEVTLLIVKRIMIAVLFIVMGVSKSLSNEFPDPKTSVDMDQSECRDISKYVSVDLNGVNHCIRYYTSGFESGINKSIVYIHGDVVWQGKTVQSYLSETEETRQALVDLANNDTGIPVVMVARPGTYGSSGHHLERRQARELELMELAVIKILQDRGVTEIALSGQSGGGSIAAYLTTKLKNVTCSVLTSPALSIQTLISSGQSDGYYYGSETIYDPIKHLEEMPNSTRIIIIGDNKDTYSLLSNQIEYLNNAKNAGLNIIRIEAEGKNHHGLDRTGWNVAGWCMLGQTSSMIIDRINRKEMRY